MRAALFALGLSLTGCSATGILADALSASSGGGAYSTDDDPELVAAAVPFGLKTMESVLVAEPDHKGLLLALSSGFVQYAFAFVLQDADRVADDDLERAASIRVRARKLLLRAREYALRGLEVDHEGFRAALEVDAAAALGSLEAKDVPLLYWATAAWALSISSAQFEPAVLAQFPTVQKFAARALALDEGYGDGSVHSLVMSLEAGRPGGDLDAATAHYERALELSGGTSVGLHVSFAESVCVKKQNSRLFHRTLDKAFEIDLDANPGKRLENTIFLRRARRLKAMSEDLFLDDVQGEETGTSTASRESRSS